MRKAGATAAKLIANSPLASRSLAKFRSSGQDSSNRAQAALQTAMVFLTTDADPIEA
jgi:phage shock protein A